MTRLIDLIARAYCWIVQRAWYGRSLPTSFRVHGSDPNGRPVSLVSNDDGQTFVDESTGETIGRAEAARRIAPHLAPYLPKDTP